MDQDPILRVEELSTFLQVGKENFPVVDSVSFDLFKGKTVALVGESGCGKSMTALSLIRILPSPPVVGCTGKVLYRGENLLDLPEKKLRLLRGSSIAMIFQDPGAALNPVYTIGDQLLEVAELHLGLFGEEAEEKVIQSLVEVGITQPKERIYCYPHQLSGGMKQRVMIAMALICEPDILIADEPTTALDVTIQAQVLDLMRALQKKTGMGILLITHDMGVVAEMADEVVVMYASQVVERGDVYDIFDQMSHPYTQGVFRSCPTLDRRKKGLEPIRGTVPSLTSQPKGCRFHNRCPYVMPKCREGAVELFSLGGEHQSLCWLHDGSEESAEKMKEGK